MGVSINLPAAARYIHGTAPSKLAGLYEAVHLKCKELGIAPFRAVAPEASTGDVEPTHNVRGVLNFVESVTKDSAPRGEKRQLAQLYATLQERFKSAGYTHKATEDEAKAAADKAKFDAAVKAEVDKQVAAKTAPKPVFAKPAAKPAAPVATAPPK